MPRVSGPQPFVLKWDKKTSASKLCSSVATAGLTFFLQAKKVSKKARRCVSCFLSQWVGLAGAARNKRGGRERNGEVSSGPYMSARVLYSSGWLIL